MARKAAVKRTAVITFYTSDGTWRVAIYRNDELGYSMVFNGTDNVINWIRDTELAEIQVSNNYAPNHYPMAVVDLRQFLADNKIPFYS